MNTLKDSYNRHSKTNRISDSIYFAIKECIIENNIPSIERFKEEEISLLLGMSRTPVRTALLLLEEDGFIVSDAKKGYVMKQFTLSETVDVIQFVRSLRIFAAGTAARRVTDSELLLLRETAFSSGNYADYQKFYLQIADITKNRYIIRDMSRMQDKLMMMWNCYPENVRSAVTTSRFKLERDELLESFSHNDSASASMIVSRYSSNLVGIVRQMYRINFDYSIAEISSFSLDTMQFGFQEEPQRGLVP